MYILYVDVDNLSVEEIQQIQESVKKFLRTPLLTLPMKYTKLISIDNEKIRGYGEDIYGRYYEEY